ncbi:MAG: cytidine deaminase [Glaciihabitans sp.]|nr:cytidine deaminase [Glaciihabitans sp.]
MSNDDVVFSNTGSIQVTPGNQATAVEQTSTIDWDALRAVAFKAMGNAYVPYSHFPVGVAAIVDDGRVIAGCNVENASYGLTLCAECALVSSLHMTGGGRLVAFTCVDGHGNALMPCGRCRQLLFEHSAPGMLLETVSGIRTIDEVLPDAFGPRTLQEYGAP